MRSNCVLCQRFFIQLRDALLLRARACLVLLLGRRLALLWCVLSWPFGWHRWFVR